MCVYACLQDDERYETAWNEWLPELWNELGTDPPAQVLLPPTYEVTVDQEAAGTALPDVLIPFGQYSPTCPLSAALRGHVAQAHSA